MAASIMSRAPQGQSVFQLDIAVSRPGVKRPAALSLPSSAKAKNSWAILWYPMYFHGVHRTVLIDISRNCLYSPHYEASCLL